VHAANLLIHASAQHPHLRSPASALIPKGAEAGAVYPHDSLMTHNYRGQEL